MTDLIEKLAMARLWVATVVFRLIAPTWAWVAVRDSVKLNGEIRRAVLLAKETGEQTDGE